MIDFANEQVVSLNEAARMLPRRREGKKPHVSTLYRWTIRGVRGVILETIQVGGTRCTSVEALHRFFERLSIDDHGDPPAVPQMTDSQRRELDRVNRELDRLGL